MTALPSITAFILGIGVGLVLAWRKGKRARAEQQMLRRLGVER